MKKTITPLALFYIVLSILGFILCMRETSHYMGLNFSYIDANLKFWNDASVNHASRSITWDIVIMYFTACTFMYRESKKIGMKYSYLYIIGGYGIAIAFTFPLFLFMRERKMNAIK
jgi:hypothetical protein